MTEQELRQAVRLRYSGRCGYCGVHESEVGAELELDHFQPRAAGGSDDIDNLVYCCPACNRNKGDFWPRHDPDAAVRRLLHPQHDPYSEHFHEAADGSLLPLSETGLFHIDRLRLNRAPLIARRLRWQRLAQAERATAMAREEVMQLRQRIGELEQAIDTLQSLLERLIRP